MQKQFQYRMNKYLKFRHNCKNYSVKCWSITFELNVMSLSFLLYLALIFYFVFNFRGFWPRFSVNIDQDSAEAVFQSGDFRRIGATSGDLDLVPNNQTGHGGTSGHVPCETIRHVHLTDDVRILLHSEWSTVVSVWLGVSAEDVGSSCSREDTWC